nr:gliding motility-associated C-terminal domain-containing protein [Prevotella sp.]
MTKRLVLFFTILFIVGINCKADDIPTISPTLKVISSPEDSANTGEQTTSYTGSAPADILFEANPSNEDGWQSYYEWHFYLNSDTSSYLVRYEETTEYTFRETGSHRIELWATFTKDGEETVSYTHTYYSDEGGTAPSVSIYESSLSFPNAFSPNGDGINDTYGAKSGYKSIVDFQATIFNRWGQKIYSWSDPSGGWDGTYNGKDVKQGTYYVLVTARGADGRKFNIKKDVNLLRGYTESTSSTTE